MCDPHKDVYKVTQTSCVINCGCAKFKEYCWIFNGKQKACVLENTARH